VFQNPETLIILAAGSRSSESNLNVKFLVDLNHLQGVFFMVRALTIFLICFSFSCRAKVEKHDANPGPDKGKEKSTGIKEKEKESEPLALTLDYLAGYWHADAGSLLYDEVETPAKGVAFDLTIADGGYSLAYGICIAKTACSSGRDVFGNVNGTIKDERLWTQCLNSAGEPTDYEIGGITGDIFYVTLPTKTGYCPNATRSVRIQLDEANVISIRALELFNGLYIDGNATLSK
jgi:hypothetical protein